MNYLVKRVLSSSEDQFIFLENELGAIGDFESKPYQSASRYDSDPEPDDLDGDLPPTKIGLHALSTIFFFNSTTPHPS